jgi:uncharacterized protein YggE
VTLWKIRHSNNDSNSERKRSLLSTAVILVAAIFAVMLVICPSSMRIVSAQTTLNQKNSDLNSNNGTLAVSGTALTKIKPDKITLVLGIQTTNKTANAALNANSKLMNKVLTVLKSGGVKENETSTSSFSISPNYNYSNTNNNSPVTQGSITGFTATNSIQIESFNTAKISKWVDTAITAGANNINSIDFTLSDKKLENIKNGLIKDAITNARGKASITASALGLRIVGVKSIDLTEGFQPVSPRVPLTTASAATASAATSNKPTPIIPGEQQVSQSVGIVFMIGK